MIKPSHLVAALIYMATLPAYGEKRIFQQLPDYTYHALNAEARSGAIAVLASTKEFQLMQGIASTCQEVYQAHDDQNRSMGYGTLCETRGRQEVGFFCWDSSGQHFGYSAEPYGAKEDWIVGSILHGCGAEVVPDLETPRSREVDPDSHLPLPTLEWGQRRPVLSMLLSDIRKKGFDIPLGYCEAIQRIRLGNGKNSMYAVVCEIDKSGKPAVICFDNFIGHFGLFTRYKISPPWIEHTIYRYCSGG
jgi:hypothetical protein